MDLLELHGVKERLLEDALSGGGQSEIAAKLTVDDLKRLFNPCRSSLRKDKDREQRLAQPESAVQDGEGQMSKTQPLVAAWEAAGDLLGNGNFGFGEDDISDSELLAACHAAETMVRMEGGELGF